MSKWKNYKQHKQQEVDRSSVQAKAQEESDRRVQDRIEQAARSAARDAMFAGQRGEIEAAASLARSKGISTVGKIVGLDSISPAAGSGWSVPDIGIEESLEADENDPRMIADAQGDAGSGSTSDADHGEQLIETKEPMPEDELEW